MTVADDLKKLADLHRSGALDNDEFAAAKRAVLGEYATDQEADQVSADVREAFNVVADNTLGQAANRYVTVQTWMAVVGLVVFALFFFLFFLPQFNRVNSAFDDGWSFVGSPPRGDEVPVLTWVTPTPDR